MVKVNKVERWGSTGSEFIQMLEDQGTAYKILYESIQVFEAVTPGITGGRHFDILEYRRPQDGQRVFAANGGFSAGDFVVEEVYFMEVEENKTYTAEEIAETLRNYIKNEEARRLKRRIEEQMNDPFDETEYDNNLYRIMKDYLTRDIDRSSEVNYKIRGDE